MLTIDYTPQEDYIDRWEAEVGQMAGEYDFSWAFTAQGNHYFNLTPLRLEEAAKAALLEAARAVSRLFGTVLPRLLGNRDALRLIGIPAELDPLLKEAWPFLTTLGRYDWALDEEGRWRLLEFNSETPSGLVEAIFLQERIAQLSGVANPNGTLAEGVREAFRRRLALTPKGEVLGLTGFLDHQEDRGNLKALETILAPLPGRRVLGDVRTLKAAGDGLTLAGERVDGLFSYYSIDWYRQDPGGQDLLRLLEDQRVWLVNPAQSLVLHSKGFFAAAWAMGEALEPQDRAALEAYLPRTYLDPDPFWGEPCVVKGFHGREGKGTLLVDGLERRGLQDLMRRDPDFFGPLIFQERIPVASLAVPVCRNGRFRTAKAYPVLSTFHLAGVDQGFFARVGGPVTDGNALWFAVL